MGEPVIGLPRSFTLVRTQGKDQLQRVGGGSYVATDGPCIVSASWDGPQNAELWHRIKSASGWGWRKLSDISGGESPAGLGRNRANRSWFMCVLRRLRRMWRTITGAPSRSTISDLRGGGVGVHTIGESAGDQKLRRDLRGIGSRTSQGRNVLPATGRCLNGIRVHQDRKDSRVPDDRVHPLNGLLVDLDRAGRKQGDTGGRGAKRRAKITQHPHGWWPPRCGRDDHHLPALTTAAGGGISK